MATKKDDTSEVKNVSDGQGIRATVSENTANWLDDMSNRTGLSKGELIEAGLSMLRQDGKQFLVDAITAKAQATINALLNDNE